MGHLGMTLLIHCLRDRVTIVPLVQLEQGAKIEKVYKRYYIGMPVKSFLPLMLVTLMRMSGTIIWEYSIQESSKVLYGKRLEFYKREPISLKLIQHV